MPFLVLIVSLGRAVIKYHVKKFDKWVKMLSKYMHFWHFNGFFRFAVKRKNHVTRGLDCGMCCIFSERQACIARHQPSELFKNVLVQAVLSLLANVKPIFNVNKNFGTKPGWGANGT